MSYPRSGNHWVRFIIEYFSGRRTNGCGGVHPPDIGIFQNTFCGENYLSHVDSQLELIFQKTHLPVQIKEKDKLLLIVRNYKECLPRHLPSGKIFNFPGIELYLKLITQFDEFKGDKLLIYYEDLMLQPKEEIIKISKFIECFNEKKFNFFMKNYDDIFHSSATAGGRYWKGCASYGKVKFHEERTDSNLIQKIDQKIKEDSQSISKYLERYY